MTNTITSRPGRILQGVKKASAADLGYTQKSDFRSAEKIWDMRESYSARIKRP